MSASLFEHPFYADLVGDPEVAGVLSAETEILTMLAVEIALAQAQAEAGLIPHEAAREIASRLSTVTQDAAELARTVGRDGVAGPGFVAQLRAAVGDPFGAFVHFGATSQDLADSALMIRLRMAVVAFEGRIGRLDRALSALAERLGEAPLMARTRMQAALPIAARDRIEAWRAPLAGLRDVPSELFAVQLGGPVGTLAEMGAAGPAVRAGLAAALGLVDVPAWHNQRDRLVRIADWLARVSGVVGKMGQDIALMAQMGEIALEGGGTSSAMPHKQNPIAAEVLVALARYNATLVGGMHHAQVHEQERSGAAWTLEWLVLPQMLMTTGAGLQVSLRLADAIVSIGEGGGSHG